MDYTSVRATTSGSISPEILKPNLRQCSVARRVLDIAAPEICLDPIVRQLVAAACMAQPFVFVSERGAPLSPIGFSHMVERAATAAELGIKVHGTPFGWDTRFGLREKSGACSCPTFRQAVDVQGFLQPLHSCHPWTDPLIDRQSCPVGQFGVTPARRARRIPRRGAASVRA